MNPPRVLISGAGVAGPTLAYWLARNGWQPTVVERAVGQRSSGNPVDVRGPALPGRRADGRAAPAARGRHPGHRDAADRPARPARPPARRCRPPAAPPAPRRSRSPAPTWPACSTRPPATTPSSSSTTPSSNCAADADGVDVALRPGRPAPLRPGRRGRRAALHGAPAGLRPRAAVRPAHGAVRGHHAAARPGRRPARHPDVHEPRAGWSPSTRPGTHALVAFIFRGAADPRLRPPRHRARTARSSRTRTPASAGGYRNCSIASAPPTTCTSTRSARSAWTPGHAAGSRCSATPRPVSRCSATAPAWPSRARTRWPPRSPPTRRTPGTRCAGTRPRTAGWSPPSSAPSASRGRCWSPGPAPASPSATWSPAAGWVGAGSSGDPPVRASRPCWRSDVSGPGHPSGELSTIASRSRWT